MLLTHWLEYKKSNGLNPGDILQINKTGKLIRYQGLAMNGIPDTPYDKYLLQFCQPFPMHPFNQINQNLAKTYYLVTKESSSQGFIDPSIVKGIEKYIFLNESVKNIKTDFRKIGNIDRFTWEMIEQETPVILTFTKRE